MISSAKRPLLENKTTTFVRYNEAISILRKVSAFKEDTFDKLVSARKPFGLDSNFKEFKEKKSPENDITLFRFGDTGYVNIKQVIKNPQWVSPIKVLVSKASPGGDTYPHKIITKPIIAPENSCSTETYLVIGTYKHRSNAENVVSYMNTRFFRFMMSLIKNTQNISRTVFGFVPVQDFSESWTDEKLYKKYKISQKEVEFIESLIQPMESSDD